jgi:PAS domain-containing protein
MSKIKILLVEDNEDNRDMLSRRLVRRGYDVVIAVDGEQGVALAHSEHPDLILMDMSLPILDGWEATRATFEQVKDAVLVTDTIGSMIFANPTALDLAGLAAEHVLGKRLSDVIDVRGPTGDPLDFVAAAKQQGVAVTLPAGTTLGTGSTRVRVTGCAEPLFDHNLDELGVSLVMWDTRDLAAVYDTIDHVQEAVLRVDSLGNIVWINQAATAMFAIDQFFRASSPLTILFLVRLAKPSWPP